MDGHQRGRYRGSDATPHRNAGGRDVTTVCRLTGDRHPRGRRNTVSHPIKFTPAVVNQASGWAAFHIASKKVWFGSFRTVSESSDHGRQRSPPKAWNIR